ncbi:TetR/AcrR family transcriptional regulator [Deinococcus cellulosilyticus]|nr:TetR/AcrR family transcriptional regulator [Deinococcus cellulosilyticus]
MTRMQQKKHDKHERISRVAWELFQKHGYEKVTTRQVAEAADIATGTLFLYASTKGDLLVMAMESALREVTRPASPLPEDPRNALRALFSGPLHLYQQHRDLARHFLVEVLRGQASEATQKNIDLFTLTLSQVLGQGVERGQLRPGLDVRQAARNFFGIYMMVLLEWLPSQESVEQGLERLDQAFELHWTGLVKA